MKKLLIFDISSFIFRAYYAIRPLSAPDGTPVNSVYGVFNMLNNAIEDLAPTHVFIAQDSKGPSFRHDIYVDYKANRSAPPDDLIPQFALIDEMIDVLKLPKLKMPLYEADDIIGSVATQFQDKFDEILIASSDKDLMQFVNEKVKMVDTMKSKIYGPDEVHEKMGVHPNQIVDYLTLVGDASDNIPGVKGIGAKGASKLLAEYGDLDTVFKNIDKFTNKRILNGLTNHKDDAILSKKLIQIKCDLKIKESLKELEYQDFYTGPEVREFLERLNFKRFVTRLYDEQKKSPRAPKETKSKKVTTKIENVVQSEDDLTSKIIFIRKQAFDFLSKIKKTSSLSVLMFNGELIVSSPTIRFSYIDEDNSFLKEILSSRLTIYSFNAKEIIKIALSQNIKIKCTLYDLSLLYFNLSPHRKNSPANLIKDLLGKEKVFDKKLDKSIPLISYSTDLLELGEKLIREVKVNDLDKIYFDMDNKLNPILAEMENTGIQVDKKYLEKLSKEYAKELQEIEDTIFELTDFKLNLKSPKQVADLLFEKLQLPALKKTKTGYSTNSAVLSQLAQTGISPIPELILQYREIDKLLSTYINAIPELISDDDKRVHTKFNQTIASTGRLSSENPNLQNIPVKSEMGRKIRKAFIPKKDHVFIAADYSQVELRILAHFCKDEVMVNAFKNNEDIHAQVASEVFGVAMKDMTPEIRSKAKAINFGLIYGQSSYGLSESLGIDRTEAAEYIKHYFQRFNKVKSFLDGLKESCEESGYSITLHGRKRPIPEIHASNRTLKSVGERMSINSPIQGTAADIIKIAMINIHEKLTKKKLETKMILQVHDELIFEVPKNEKDQILKLVKEEMESAVELDVPLKVDINEGKSWFDLK